MKPMLAASTDGTNLVYPMLVSPKLDGVRCLIQNGVAVSRSLKPIPNSHVQRLFGRAELNGLDGELIVGPATAPDCYTRTTSGVMSVEGIPDVFYFVFDKFSDQNFVNRLHAARNLAGDRVIALPHTSVSTQAALEQYEAAMLAEGYEGVMLRDPHGRYKQGRSTLREGGLIKLKRFKDSEAIIVGYTQLMRNTNETKINALGHQERSHKKEGMIGAGVLGSLTVRDVHTGVEFDIGTGFNDAQREEFWRYRTKLTWLMIKYKSQPVGVKDKPRFPVFLGFRDLIDF